MERKNAVRSPGLGERFGSGVVLEAVLIGPRRLRGAVLQCDCGNKYEATIYHLLEGHTLSCGCLRLQVVTLHGLWDHPLYNTWVGMMHRCYTPTDRGFKNYGARGIRVCERWHDVATFIHDIERWLGPRPPGMSLDRMMNDHDYRLDNVKWSTPAQQVRNRRGALRPADVEAIRSRYEAGGVTQAALAREYGVNQSHICNILNRKQWM